jgi:P4 family phage/plasmid primase-like protien
MIDSHFIDQVNRAAMARIDSLVSDWLPGGKTQGSEYVARNPTRADSSPGSFKVNLRTCTWKDFATSDKGGNDAISLYRYLYGIDKMGEAARKLAASLGVGNASAVKPATDPSVKRKSPNIWQPILPVPPEALSPDEALKKAHQIWIYKNEKSELLGFITRRNRPDGKKDYYPLTYCQNSQTGECEWRTQGFPHPRPIYGLDELARKPSASVLIVEGEKAADAARKLLNGSVAVVSWPGGAQAIQHVDWSPVFGRRIAIWPDNDAPGREAAINIADLLYAHSPTVKIIDPPDEASGWDLADAEGSDWDSSRVKKWITEHFTVHIPAPKAEKKRSTTEDLEVGQPIVRDGMKTDADGNPYEQVGFYYKYEETNKKGEVKTRIVPQFRLMANYCAERKDMVFDDAKWMRHDGKMWTHLSRTGLQSFIHRENAKCIRPEHIDQFGKMIRAACYSGNYEFKDTDGLINIANGIINARTSELMPHSPHYKFEYCTDVAYEPNAECPTWENFLCEIFERNIELIDLAQRLFGYIMIGGAPFLHRAFVLYGSGRNGKSTFLEILRAIIGRKSYSVVSMGKLDKEFSIVNIEGKLANIVEETPTDEINAEIFKNMVGGGEVQAAHKGFDEYSFKCHARFIFACNDMPVFRDKSVGLEERLVFIPFNRYFEDHERDTNIIPKLMAELPGILNWAIEGARTMLAQRSLPNYQTTAQMKELYRDETNPLINWMNECVTVSASGSQMTTKEIYAEYRRFCEESGCRSVSKINFGRQFRAEIKKRITSAGLPYNEKARAANGDDRVIEWLIVKGQNRQMDLPHRQMRPNYVPD